MSVAEGLSVRLVAAEPLVRQPVAIDFDDRGRLWVMQYLQYPNPEGLQRVAVDRYSRTRYDRVPPPPPRGPKGADRLTILEDTDGDGRMDHFRDFVSGLNLASGFAFGDNGIYVLNVPYLLFYADRDHDDTPDGDPEVLLSGFGMEDAHSVANSLTWGPDGWLYGLQGSTVTANVRGVEFQQGVWRYHPPTRRFELFAEGGGNMWGLDFDRDGRLIASTNVGGNAALHFVQGGHFWKSFGKHGPLHNPYTYGYFEHVPHEGLKGGHVTVGGLFYFADAWPARYRGKYLTADLLDHSAHWHEFTPSGTTVRARQLGDLVRANDTWFAPTDMTLGPDGSVYVADWHDRRTAHPDPDADWDKTNGRVFAIDGPATSRPGKGPTPEVSHQDLIASLDHPNIWYVRRARRILGERRDPSTWPELKRRAMEGRGPTALEGLWALHSARGLDEPTALALLEHPDAPVRAWVVRLLGDDPPLSPAAFARVERLASEDPSVVVRAQVACTAARLKIDQGPALAARLATHDEDVRDERVPLLVWWAVEKHATDPDPRGFAPFVTPAARGHIMVREVIAPRLVRRLVAERDESNDERALTLVAGAAGDRETLLRALDEGTRGRPARPVGPALKNALDSWSAARRDDATLLRLAARFGDTTARAKARELLADPSTSVETRKVLIDLAEELGDPAFAPALQAIACEGANGPLTLAALGALARFDDPAIAPALIASYPKRPAAWRSRARDVLLARRKPTALLLDAVDRGEIDPADFATDQLARVGSFQDEDLDVRVLKRWGSIRGATPEERLAEVRRLNNDLNAGPGDLARGRGLFEKHCAGCHRLFGEGARVGPDLTHANRVDRQFLLVSLVDPSAVVRKEFQAVTVATKDGRVLTGVPAEADATSLTLLGPKDERVTISRSDVEETRDSSVSLMTEGLYRNLMPQDLRDLFAYLQQSEKKL